MEKRLEELGVELPEVPPAVANYIPGVAVGEERGKHARSALNVNEFTCDAPLEIILSL